MTYCPTMIVIVGAGLAGLAAAWKLTKANVNDFIIVEAQDRVGGRIQSIYKDDGCRLDLGAQWLHGQRENPIYEWLQGLACIEGPEDEEVEFEGLFATQHGQEASRLVTSRVLEILLEAKGQLYKLSPLLSKKICKPIDVFRAAVEQELSRCPMLKSADPKLIEAVQRWFELYEMIDNSCESLDLLSIRAYSEWSDFDGGQMVKLKGGWQSVVDKMKDIVDQDKIRLSCPVQQIDYSSRDIVKVKLLNGELIQCDHVIVTVSLGVLRGSVGLFEPPLDRTRRYAIDNGGFGPTNKIFLEFQEPFLRVERGLKLLWLAENNNNKLSEQIEYPSWSRFITGFDLVNGAPDCLLAWVGGKGAIEMETQSDEELARVCLNLIKQFLPADKGPPPKLISIARSRWAGNPHIRGAYSYQSAASIDVDSRTVWEPVYSPSNQSKASLLFAGEASAGNMHATAHGAIISGWREADRLIRFYGQVLD